MKKYIMRTLLHAARQRHQPIVDVAQPAAAAGNVVQGGLQLGRGCVLVSWPKRRVKPAVGLQRSRCCTGRGECRASCTNQTDLHSVIQDHALIRPCLPCKQNQSPSCLQLQPPASATAEQAPQQQARTVGSPVESAGGVPALYDQLLAANPRAVHQPTTHRELAGGKRGRLVAPALEARARQLQRALKVLLQCNQTRLAILSTSKRRRLWRPRPPQWQRRARQLLGER